MIQSETPSGQRFKAEFLPYPASKNGPFRG